MGLKARNEPFNDNLPYVLDPPINETRQNEALNRIPIDVYDRFSDRQIPQKADQPRKLYNSIPMLPQLANEF